MSCLLKCRVLVHAVLAATLSLLLLAICGFGHVLAADDAATLAPLSAVKTAHDELRTWLNESENGRGWLRYLDADQLERQIALGDRADKSIVRRISARYAEQHT